MQQLYCDVIVPAWSLGHAQGEANSLLKALFNIIVVPVIIIQQTTSLAVAASRHHAIFTLLMCRCIIRLSWRKRICGKRTSMDWLDGKDVLRAAAKFVAVCAFFHAPQYYLHKPSSLKGAADRSREGALTRITLPKIHPFNICVGKPLLPPPTHTRTHSHTSPTLLQWLASSSATTESGPVACLYAATGLHLQSVQHAIRMVAHCSVRACVRACTCAYRTQTLKNRIITSTFLAFNRVQNQVF